MKEGWIVKKLGEVVTFCNGYTPKEAELMNCGEIPYFKVSDMNHVLNLKYLNYTTLYLNKGCKTYPKNTIVFPKNGAAIATNKKRLLAQESVVDLNTGGVYLNTNELLYEYLYLYFLNIDFKVYTRRGAVPTLDIAELKNLKILIPSLEEQSRIVEELDQLSNIIEKKRQQLSELDNLTQAIFYDMFGDPVTNEKGWKVKKLGETCKSDLGKTLNQSKDKGEYHYYLCAINVLWGYINLNNLKQARFEELELEKYSVQKGDLLICEGGDVGRAAIWNEAEPMLYQNALHRVRFDKSILAIYALYWLQWLKNQGELDKYIKGVTIKHLVKSSLLSIPICIPPLDLQQLFAQKIEAIEKEKELIKQSIKETEELFNSKMEEYFG